MRAASAHRRLAAPNKSRTKIMSDDVMQSCLVPHTVTPTPFVHGMAFKLGLGLTPAAAIDRLTANDPTLIVCDLSKSAVRPLSRPTRHSSPHSHLLFLVDVAPFSPASARHTLRSR